MVIKFKNHNNVVYIHTKISWIGNELTMCNIYLRIILRQSLALSDFSIIDMFTSLTYMLSLYNILGYHAACKCFEVHRRVLWSLTLASPIHLHVLNWSYSSFCMKYIFNYNKIYYIVNEYKHGYLPVCVCSLILTRSTGHATISWAAPPAEPARNICVYDPKFWVLAEDSIARRDVPYTPKNREFIAPADKIGYHIPLNSPRIYDDIHILYLSQRI